MIGQHLVRNNILEVGKTRGNPSIEMWEKKYKEHLHNLYSLFAGHVYYDKSEKSNILYSSFVKMLYEKSSKK